jgi:hypothetical protein
VRGKLVFLLILAMLVGLVYLVGTRTRDAHVMPKPRPEEVREAAAPVASVPSASASSDASPAPADAAVAGDAKAPLLDRPLRLVASTWEQAAAALVANGGKTTADGSLTRDEGLDLHVDVASTDQDIDNRLARGGGDPDGADVAVMPLPAFVASYERIRALEPQIVHIVGWSRGREVLLGARDGMLAKQGASTGELSVVSVDPSATVLALFALDEAGVPPTRVHLVADSKTATLAALARPLSPDRPADAPSRVLLTTAEATRLVPLVAVAARGFVEGHAATVTALLRAWDRGATELRKDVPAAARRIAAEAGAPEPATMLERLGWMSDPGRADEGIALGLLGSDAITIGDAPITVGLLFARDWQLLRDAGLLTSPTPQPPHRPVAVCARLPVRHRAAAARGRGAPGRWRARAPGPPVREGRRRGRGELHREPRGGLRSLDRACHVEASVAREGRRRRRDGAPPSAGGPRRGRADSPGHWGRARRGARGAVRFGGYREPRPFRVFRSSAVRLVATRSHPSRSPCDRRTAPA